MQVRSSVKIGGILAAIAALLAMGVVIAVKSVNLDQVKAMLTNQVKNATGRTLTIAGPLELQAGLFPVLVAHGVTLSNPAGSTRPDMVKIDHVEMEMALMPLFKREILVNRLIVSSLDILIETEAEGAGNLSFRHPTAPSEPQSPTAKEEGTVYQFNLNELTITNALVAWHDRTSNKTESASIKELTLSPDPIVSGLLAIGLQTTVREHKIELSGTVGRLAAAFDDQPWPIKLKAHIKGFTLSAEGIITDLATFSGIKIKVAGQGAELMDVARLTGVTTPQLPQSLGPFKVSAHLSDAGKRLNLTDVVVEAGKRELLLLQAKGAVHDLVGTAAVDLAVNMESDNPSAAAKLAGVDMSGKGRMTLSGQLHGSDTVWKVNDLNLNARIDASNLNAQGSVADLASLSGVKVRIDGQGAELMDVARLAGVTTPQLPQSLGPFKVSALLSDAGKRLNLTDVVVEAGKRELLLLQAKGAVHDLVGTAAVDLAVNMESDNPSAAAKLAGVDMSGKGRMTLSGQLHGSDTVWKVNDLNLNARIDASNLNAQGSVADLASLSGVKVRIDGQGAELMDVARLAGVTTPQLPQSLGPFKVSALLSAAGKQLNLTDVVVEAGKRELLLLQAKGAVHDLVGTAAVDLAVNMESDNPSAAAKLAGVDMSGKGRMTLSGQLHGSDTVWKVNDLNLNARIDASNLNAQGSVADLASLSGVKVRIDGQGAELMDVARLAGVTTPDLPQSLGPFKVSALLSDAGKRLNLTDVVVEAGTPALLLLNAKGTVKDVTGTVTVDLAVNMESDNPHAVVKLAGGEFSGKGPLKLAGQLRGSDTTWNMTNLKSSVGGSDLSGELTTSFTARPRLSGKLTSSTLHLADFTTTTVAPEQSGPQSAQAKGGDGRIFSNQPLPVALLRSVDADLSVQAAKLILDNRQLTDVTVVLQLNAGRLAINPFQFGLAGGVVEGEATLDATGTTPIVALQMNGRQVELGKIDSKGPIIGGKSDMQVDMKSNGESIRALMAAATGETSLSVGEGRLRSRAIDRAAGDLLFQVVGAINPFTRSEDTTQMTCAAVRFVIRDGIATADNGIAMRTSQVDVMGSGTVDLRTEKLDLGIRPRTRGGVGLSLTTPLGGLVRVGGTIAKPTIGIDAAGTLRTAASVGAGIATGGLSIVGGMLLSRVTADEDPCRTVLGQP